MVYESDFYTTRRPYSRPTISSYTVSRRQVPWEMVPDVPRPSQVPPVFTAFGKVGKYEEDKARKSLPRKTDFNAGLPKGVQSVYPRRYPNPTPTQMKEDAQKQVLISRKYAPRRVTFEGAEGAAAAAAAAPQLPHPAVKLPGDEFIERLLSGEHPAAATPLPGYSTNYQGPLRCYSTYYHA